MVGKEAASGPQLRKYPRLAVMFPLTYAVDNGTIEDGRARDIGGGGVYFESNEAISANSSITMWFELRPGLKIEVSGKLVATKPDPSTKVHQHRLMFTQIADDMRDSILAYIFDEWRNALLSRA